MSFNKQQLLIVAIPDRNHHAAALAQLVDQRLGDMVQRGGYGDGVKWRELRPTLVSITVFHENILVAETLQIVSRTMNQFIDDLNREDLRHQS